MAASKESILAHRSKLEPLDIPEWGGTVYLRVMSGTERDAYESEQYIIKGKSVELNRANARARLLMRTLCDENGNRLFNDLDAATLGNQPADVMDKAFTVALRVNGFTAADVEDLVKNSGSGQSEDSGSN